MATRRPKPSRVKKKAAEDLKQARADLHAFQQASGKLTGRKGALIVARLKAASYALEVANASDAETGED